MASGADSIFAPVFAAADRAGLTEFLRWWKAELEAMIPVEWRERLASRGTAFVDVQADVWRALRPSSGSLVELGRANLGELDLAARRVAFRHLVRESAGGTLNVWLVLPQEELLTRSVTLPLAAEEALRDAVGFELDRLTPFSAEQACFDFRVTGRDAAAQRLSLDLAVTALRPVAARLEQLRGMGATVLGVGVAGDIATSTAPLNLLDPEERDSPATSRTALAARVLAAVAGTLAVIALAYPIWQKREAVIELQPRLDRAKAGADVADRLGKEIEKLASEHNFLLAKKQGLHPTVTLVEDLSRLLPDTTWVQQLDIRAGQKVRELQIAGETGSSPQLIEVLEKSGSLVNASFKSPLTKGVTPGTERFLIAAEVKPRPLPEPMPESELAKVPADPSPAIVPQPVVPKAPAGPPPAPGAPAPEGGPAMSGGPAVGSAPPAAVPRQPSVTPAVPQPGSSAVPAPPKVEPGAAPKAPAKPAAKG